MQKKISSKRNNRIYLILVLAAIVIILIVAIVAVTRRTEASASLKPGREYIQSLEQMDTGEIESEIRDHQIEKQKKALESDDVNIWQMFSDIVIVGDSRAEEFDSYELLDDRHVISKIGYSARLMLDQIEDITARLESVNPASVILVFGLNDIENSISVETYIEQLTDILTQIEEALPETTVYINSIIPTTQSAIDKQPLYEGIPSWNDEVKAYCEEHEIPYIDITDTVEEHTDLYDDDGIHMKKEFLEYWAYDMITEIIENEQ